MNFNESPLYNVRSNFSGKRYSLYDLATWRNGIAFRKIDFSDTGLPVIKIAELNNGVGDTTAYTNQVFSENVHIYKGDLLFSWSGNPQTSIDIYRFKMNEGWLNQHIFKVVPNEKIVDRDYFYYLMKYLKPYFTQIATNKQTTGLGHVTIGDIKRMNVVLPSLNIQEAIAKVLLFIDDKIDINETINRNLVQQAQTLFKSWFVNFDPFGGTMPNNWVYGTIADLAQNIICGKTPSTKKDEYYGNDIPFITIPDMHNSIYIVKTERYLSSLSAASQSNKTLLKNSICVSCIGTAGLVSLVSEESQTNQQINSIVPKKGCSPFYIYLLMRTLPETINKLGQSGSTIVNLNKAQFSKITALIPTETVMKSFDELLSPLFESILNNQKQNGKLSKLRDTLLSRLMSGELDVSTLDI